jgi:tRNA-specific 2-thiouridylase
VNLEKEFEKEIIDDFVSEYEQGRTPNPCVRCNSLIKFKYLLTKAQELGADLLVTGHYAQIVERDGTFSLFKGIDTHKDQSYFLYNLNQEQMRHVWFPLGELAKTDTRKLASKYKLKTAQKSESQDICFVTTTTQDFLADKIKAKSGNIVNISGEVIGKHEGLPFYTIGQRKGLGGGFSEPMYVVGLDVSKNEVVVGNEKNLYSSEMVVGDVTWTKDSPKFPVEMEVKIRYNSEASVATLSFVTLSGTKGPGFGVLDSSCGQNDVKIKFHTPQKAITPGQTAVFYLGDEVIGGGVIILSTRHA